MRRISLSREFRKDHKRELRGRFARTLDADLHAVVERLARDEPLEQRFRDHPLTGRWRRFRDCHIHPDLVLIYRLTEDGELILTRLGTPSELGF